MEKSSWKVGKKIKFLKLFGIKHFQISLKSVSNKETILVSVLLQTLTEQLFTDIRSGMKKLTLEDVREILNV